MNQFKKVQVIMLPTENNTNLLLCIKDYTEIRECDDEWGKKGDIIEDFKVNKLYLGDSEKCDLTIFTPQHLYIISNDKIEENDWYLHKDKIYQAITGEGRAPKGINNLLSCKKIITTTDLLIIGYTVDFNFNEIYKKISQPSQQFIEKYIESYNKGEIITNVLVEYEEGLERPLRYSSPLVFERLKVNGKDIIKVSKDNWNREEVIKILYNFAEYCQKHDDNSYKSDKWIKENL